MTARSAIRFAILAATIVMGCAERGKDGPPGDPGPTGPQGETGPAGEAGPPARGVAWRDATGALVPTVTQSFSPLTFTRVLMDDGAGHLWTVNPSSGRLEVVLVTTTSGASYYSYFTEPGCLGDAYIDATSVPPPGFVFRVGATGYRSLPPSVTLAEVDYQSTGGSPCFDATGTISGISLTEILAAPVVLPPAIPPAPWTASVTR